MTKEAAEETDLETLGQVMVFAVENDGCLPSQYDDAQKSLNASATSAATLRVKICSASHRGSAEHRLHED